VETQAFGHDVAQELKRLEETVPRASFKRCHLPPPTYAGTVEDRQIIYGPKVLPVHKSKPPLGPMSEKRREARRREWWCSRDKILVSATSTMASLRPSRDIKLKSQGSTRRRLARSLRRGLRPWQTERRPR